MRIFRGVGNPIRSPGGGLFLDATIIRFLRSGGIINILCFKSNDESKLCFYFLMVEVEAHVGR